MRFSYIGTITLPDTLVYFATKRQKKSAIHSPYLYHRATIPLPYLHPNSLLACFATYITYCVSIYTLLQNHYLMFPKKAVPLRNNSSKDLSVYLTELNILNYKNIHEASLHFVPKINCFVGDNGMGKTNVLDAIYYLSFCKSAFNSIDSQNIRHDEPFAMIQGSYAPDDLSITCGLRRGMKKQFRCGQKDYKRLIDHIGKIPLVLVSPRDSELISDGSEERRRFVDSVISQYNRDYLQRLTTYNALLKQRNALLKQIADARVVETPYIASLSDAVQVSPLHGGTEGGLLDVLELQMADHANYIFAERTQFIEAFLPHFQEIYNYIAEHKEQVSLTYVSQLQNRDLAEAFRRTRERDLILGWTSQGIHKDDLDMRLGEYPLRQVASQGQQKTYLIALKLAQAIFLSPCIGESNRNCILLLDDIFDKLDAHRVQRIVELVNSDRFGQIFITDTDRQHLVDILRLLKDQSKVFQVHNGEINEIQ